MMISLISIVAFWLLGIVLGYCIRGLQTTSREAETLDLLAKALHRHDWELENPPLDDREYLIVGEPPYGHRGAP